MQSKIAGYLAVGYIVFGPSGFGFAFGYGQMRLAGMLVMTTT